MRIAHCQFETWSGEFEHNLKRVAEGLARAAAERAEIVSFPECFLTGCPDTEDGARRGAFAMDSPQIAKALDLTSRFDPPLIVGFNELRGADIYNTALVASRACAWRLQQVRDLPKVSQAGGAHARTGAALLHDQHRPPAPLRRPPRLPRARQARRPSRARRRPTHAERIAETKVLRTYVGGRIVSNQ